ELNIKNFNLVILADDTILNSFGDELSVDNKSFKNFGVFRKYKTETKKNIDKNTFHVIKTSSYDINKYGIKLNKTKYYYDGKLIYPEIDYRGFVIDDYVDVRYENNLKPGVGRVIITAKTKFTGTVVLDFDILGHKKGTVLTDGKLLYKVTKTGAVGVAGKVSVIGVKKKSLKKINIKAAVKFNGVKYDVVSIGKKAFKNSKKIKSIVIGKNVSKIGKGAFAGCKKLKSIKIKSKKIKKFAKGTFKGVKNTCVIKVPKKKKKAYIKKLVKAGFKGIVK
ncbi:leucine-rich repeat protein, partial [Eubacterium sp.]|uniref:leucine-rich repeat protein n=1 Tax=Eubacterium sp. TaxID=142586 RepID=UPI0025CCB7AB